jgi:hypothetical protein
MLHFQKENYAYFRAIWRENIQPIHLPENIKSTLPKATVDFLEQVGLPLYNREEDSEFDFSPFDDRLKMIHFQEKEFILIGRDTYKNFSFYNLVCLEKMTGKVFLLHTDVDKLLPLSDHPVNFVNATLPQYLASLVTFEHFYFMIKELGNQFYEKYARLPDMEDDEALAVGEAIQTEVNLVVEDIKNRLKGIDTIAIEDIETYWSQRLFNFSDL